MEQSTALRIRHWSRRPKAMLMLTGAAVVILNAVFFAWQTLPGYLQRNEEYNALSAVRQQWEGRSHQPSPQKVSDQAIAQLLSEVPTSIEPSQVISTLLEFSAEAEVWISLFKQGDETAAAGKLQQQINSLSESEPSGVVEKGSGEENADTSLLSDSQPKGNALHEESIELNVVGSLPKLWNFFDLVANNGTITNISTWTLTEVSESDSLNIPELKGTTGNYAMKLTFSLYSMPEYAEVFGVDNNQDVPIEDMLDQLKNRLPGIQTFESIRTE